MSDAHVGFKPRLNPNQPPGFHSDINPCSCGAFDGYIPMKNLQFVHPNGKRHDIAGDGAMHITSVVLLQDDEGWFYVTCVECHKEGMKAASGETAIKLWNESNQGGQCQSFPMD